jgi:hypothetical protein
MRRLNHRQPKTSSDASAAWVWHLPEDFPPETPKGADRGWAPQHHPAPTAAYVRATVIFRPNKRVGPGYFATRQIAASELLAPA